MQDDLFASDGEDFDPAAYAGFFVYLLWKARGDDKPMYVGSSHNILGRINGHLHARGGRVGWITLIRCADEAAMLKREGELIRLYRPQENRSIPLVPELHGGRKVERVDRTRKALRARLALAQLRALPPGEDREMTTGAVARHMGVPISTVICWRSEGYGPTFYMDSGKLRYRLAAVEAWMAEQARTGREERGGYTLQAGAV